MTRTVAKLRNVRNIVVMQREKFVREANLVSEETENVCEVFQNTSSFPDARLTCETFPERLYREIIFCRHCFPLKLTSSHRRFVMAYDTNTLDNTINSTF